MSNNNGIPLNDASDFQPKQPPSSRHPNSTSFVHTLSSATLYDDDEDVPITHQFLENVLGKTVKPKKAAVPTGYSVDYTKSGVPFLSSPDLVDFVDPVDELAAHEHTKHNLTMGCSINDIESKFGIGIYLYFDFLRFCIFINAVLLAGVLVNLVPHLYYETSAGAFKGYSIRDAVFVTINLASYVARETRLLYYWSTFGCIVLSFLMGPIYAWRINRYFRKRSLLDFEDGFEHDDEIKENITVSHGSRLFRYLVSNTIFVLLIGLSAVCTIFVLKTVNDYKIMTNILTTSLVSAVIIRVINVIYEFICLYLTHFEKHRTWTNFRNHNTLKLFVFKVINVLVLYLLRDKIFRGLTNETIIEGCPLIDVGSQFLFILVLDLTIQNIWEIIYSLALARIGKFIGKHGKKSTEYYKPEFDLADEYIEILYRQFIVYLGLSIYPLVTVFGILCNFVEIYVDKYRLLRICRRPHRIQGSMKKFLTFYLLIVAVVSVASYPYGSGWVLVQFGMERGDLNHNCPQIFSNNHTIPLNLNK
eukprot:gene7744-9075_t